MRAITEITRVRALVGAALCCAGCVAAPPSAETEGEVAELNRSYVGPACNSDADCRVEPDYCAECACVPLGAQQKMPECLGEELKCLQNPCADHTAVCIEGRCTAASGALR